MDYILRFNTQIARLMRRNHWIATYGVRLWQMKQAHFTLGVVAVISNEQNEVLLVEHVFHPKYPWGLPGGWVDQNETPQQALMREMQEELSLLVTIDRIILIDHSSLLNNHVDIAMLCRTNDSVGNLSPELLGYAWHKADNLPNLSSFHSRAIQKMFE